MACKHGRRNGFWRCGRRWLPLAHASSTPSLPQIVEWLKGDPSGAPLCVLDECHKVRAGEEEERGGGGLGGEEGEEETPDPRTRTRLTPALFPSDAQAKNVMGAAGGKPSKTARAVVALQVQGGRREGGRGIGQWA